MTEIVKIPFLTNQFFKGMTVCRHDIIGVLWRLDETALLVLRNHATTYPISRDTAIGVTEFMAGIVVDGTREALAELLS